jgi:hypothetical protein
VPEEENVALARRWRQLVLVVALVAASLTVVPESAHAELPQLSGMFLRDSSRTVFRQPGIDGATLTVVRAPWTYGEATVPVFHFVSEVDSLSSTYRTAEVSADLAVGTYAASRLAGQAPAVVSTNVSGCSDAGPATLTVTEAEYDADGLPVHFAASFQIAPCGNSPAVNGELRWHSSAPIAFAQAPDASTLSQPVTVNSVADLTLTLTGRGNGPTTLGAATLHQTPLWDGSVYWSIVSNGCTGTTLAPGATCALILRFTPVRPNGYPEGFIDATVELGDGHADPTVAHISATVKPLAGQPVNLVAEGAFRHLVLRWGTPLVYPLGWARLTPTTYRVYQFRPDGSQVLIGSVQRNDFVIANLPDGYRAKYAVTASQTSTGPISVPTTGTTAASELLTATYQTGIRNRRLAPDAAANPVLLRAENFIGSASGVGALAVSRNQSVLAWADTEYNLDPISHATVHTVSLTGAVGSDFASVPGLAPQQWDTEPSLSPDGSRVVYTHAAAPGEPTVLRIARTASGSTPVDLAGSADLHDPTFSADGLSVVAVRGSGAGTELVRLNLGTGTLSPVPGSTGLSQPDVAADGRIVAVLGTDEAQPRARALVLLLPGATASTVVPAAQAGSNSRPRFSADGGKIFYTHRDDVIGGGDYGTGAMVDLSTGTATMLTDAGADQTPYVLSQDGQHRTDQTPPVVRITGPASLADLAATATVSWTGADATVAGASTSGVWNYDVRYRTSTASRDTKTYGYPAAWQHTTGTRESVPALAGTEYCFSVRARDLAGNLSAWSADRCTASPLDDRSLSSTAARLTSSAYYRATFSRTTSAGVPLSRTGVTATRVGIVATSCTSCGAVDVTLAGKYLGRVNLRASSTHYRQSFWLPGFPLRSGTLVLRSVSSAQVLLDGALTVR